MRVISLNGAAFIFLQKGERLKENEGLAHNKFPDRRYVLWPRGDGWDVRVKLYHFGKASWEPVADSLFSDEDAAWQAAFVHLNDNPTSFLYTGRCKREGFYGPIQTLMQESNSYERDF